MARILFTLWPFAGHVHPSLAVAHALAERGHDVAFYTGGAVRKQVEGEGFQFFPFKAVDEERTTAIVSNDFPYALSMWGRLRQARRMRGKFREWLLDTVPGQVRDIEDILAQWPADVIVCDLAFWGPILVLHERKSIPVAVLSVLAACILPGSDAPLWGFGLPRPRTAAAKLRNRIAGAVQRRLSRAFVRDVNAIRDQYGLPRLTVGVTEYAGRMPLYLVPSAEEYDYQRRDLPPSVHYVGPFPWDGPRDQPPPDWLASIPADRPLIYVTEATVGTTEPFLLKAAAEGLKDLPVEVVMTTGKQRDPADLRGIADNVRVESYIPQSRLLPRMSVMVTLGGSGGVLAALSAGVPLVVVPTEWDRPENAQRVVEAGAGVRLAAEQCTPARLRAAVERVLREPSFRANAARMAEVFQRCGGPPRAARLIEELSPARHHHSELVAASRGSM